MVLGRDLGLDISASAPHGGATYAGQPDQTHQFYTQKQSSGNSGIGAASVHPKGRTLPHGTFR